jgi:hypothetical protein
MALPDRPRHAWSAVLPLACLVLFAATPAHALRVVDYNILNYPGSTGSARATYYQTILAPLDADVIVTEEMASPTANTQFLNDVLNVMEPGEWATAPFVDGNDTDASLFYKPAKVTFLGQWSFYPNPSNLLRLVHVYRIMPVGYTAAAAELRLYACHLKASTGYESQRLAECTGIRDSMNAMPPGTHALVGGDMNFYTQSAETGYAKLLENQTNNVGRVYDMLPAGAWHDGATFAPYHTQSPCKDGTCASGAATGGMDDRFDMVLPTFNLGTGQGLSTLAGTMKAVGNDGLHLNLNITDSPTIPEGAAYATALKLASDHLPVRVDLQLPAEISTDASLAFGSVIVGATATGNLTVSNPALAPADSLNCSFVAPSGFTAPGPLAVVAGGSAAAAIGLGTASAGARSGDLTITSDAVDSPSVTVALSGTVLDHAQASLDSLSAVPTDTLDFGQHDADGFTPQPVAVHDRDYQALRARLAVNSATIVGGDGRFSIAGFTPTLVAGTAGRWSVSFDAAGATSDSTYRATLTFTDADEPLPGAAAQPDLVVGLLARISAGTTAVGPAPPTLTRLYPPMPNPLTAGSTLRFDLARPGNARLEVFDLSGRRVAQITDQDYAAGRYSLRWDGRGESGMPLGSGLYFVRLSTRGATPQTARLAIVR